MTWSGISVAKEDTVARRAIQDFYPKSYARCYGCGRLNEHGLHIKSYVENGDAVAVLHPRPFHIAFPGYVYGGLIASLIDCHSMATAAAAASRAEGREMAAEPGLRFVTASLHVDYLKPTPIGVPLEVRGHVKEITPRKVLVETTVTANGQLTARGEVVAVQMPDTMMARKRR